MEQSKRGYIRVNDKFNVRIVINNDTSQEADIGIHSSKSINVSATGLLINTHDRLDKGTIVHVIFMKPHSFDFFKGPGKVLRVEADKDGSYNVAISFLSLSPEDQKTLDYYLQQDM